MASCHFCFGLEMTQIEKPPFGPVVNFNSTRKGVMDNTEYGT